MRLSSELESLSQDRREKEQKITHLIDDKVSIIQNEIERESQQRTTNLSYISSLVQNDLPRLESSLRESASLREEMDASIMKKTADELGSMKHTLDSERRNR